MSDLRLEDLLTITEYGRGHATAMRGCVRQVSRVEVLEALGARREWWCRALNGRRCTGPWPEGPVPRTHAGCGWRWVATDE